MDPDGDIVILTAERPVTQQNSVVNEKVRTCSGEQGITEA